MKNKKGFLRNLAYGAVGLALLGGTYITVSNSHLKPEDFNKAKWIESDNPSGTIWHGYMSEKNIVRTPFNWHMYIDEVREKNSNKNNLEGKILLPDLDGDNKVGK